MHWILCHHKIFSYMYTAGIIRHYHKSAKLGLIQSIVNNSSKTLYNIQRNLTQEITNVPVAFVWKRAQYWYDNTSTFFKCSKFSLLPYPYNWQVEGLLIPSMPKTNIKYYSTYISYLCVQHMAQKLAKIL